MVSLFIFNRPNPDDDELLLGAPDLSEGLDLKRHSERCAMRYRMFSKRLFAQSGAIRRVEVILYGLAIYLLLTSKMSHDALQFLLTL